MPSPFDPFLDTAEPVAAVALTLAMLWVGIWALTAWALPALRDSHRRREHVVLAALVMAAWALRVAAPATPHDINPRVLFPGDGAVSFVSFYGIGMLGWTRLVGGIAPSTHAVLFEAAAVVGALVLVPMWSVLGRVGVSTRARVWCLAAVATQPVLVRYGHTDNQSIVALWWLWLGLAALARFGDERRTLDAVAAGLALGAAMTFRPTNLVLGLLALTAVPVLARPAPWRDRRTWVAMGLAAVLSATHLLHMIKRTFYPRDGAESLAPWTWEAQLGPGGFFEGPGQHGLMHWVVFDPAYTSPASMLALAVGVVAGAAPRSFRGWALAWTLLLGLNGMAWSPFGGNYLIARHHLLMLGVAPLLMGLGWSRLVDWMPGLARPVVVVIALVAWWRPLPLAWSRAGETVEYEFLAATVPHLTNGCAVYHVEGNRTLSPVWWLSDELGKDHRWVDVFPGGHDADPIAPGGAGDPAADAACKVYYRLGNCFTTDEQPEVWRRRPADDTFTERAPMMAACQRFEESVDLEPIVTTRIPNTTLGYSNYADGVLEVGWWRVVATPSP